MAVNKLRAALSDSAENPRYIETVPGRGYRFIGSLERPHSAPIPLSAGLAIQEEPPRRRSVERRWWLAAIGACVAIAFAAGGWLYRQRTEPIAWDLTRLTANTGFSGFPALSPDGRLLAYSSDQGSDDGVDLYIKEVSGGSSIRLTSDGEGNRAPDFSPDGAKIVFRSDRNGGGIYEIPTLGGEVRFVARDGLDPKFSPDGSQVAYWVGDPGIAHPDSWNWRGLCGSGSRGSAAASRRELHGCAPANLVQRRKAPSIDRVRIGKILRRRQPGLVVCCPKWRRRGEDGRQRTPGARAAAVAEGRQYSSVCEPVGSNPGILVSGG